MYKIGELSKLCRLPVKTLRYYDSVGLLVPDETDRFTGYRYYSAARLADCNRIVALKELGFSLDEIRRHLSADSTESVVSLLDVKAEELKSLLCATESQLRRLEAAKQIITEGEKKMFDVIIRSADAVRVAYVRQLFKTKADAYRKIEEIKSTLPKHTVGSRTLIINYETEYRESEFDLAACVEITAKLPSGCGFEDRTVTLPGEVASLVCKAEELDAAYRSMSKQLDEQNTQVIGAYYEFYHDGGTVELKVPVYRPSVADSLKDDNSETPFVNDEEALGKWKLLDIVPSEEQFLYGHRKCTQDGWHNELYFLENGEPYWVFGGWTKGYIRHRNGEQNFLNEYEIKDTDGHKLLLVKMKTYADREKKILAYPDIWVYEKVSGGRYHSCDIKRRDNIDYRFTVDNRVIGEWSSFDFCRPETLDKFNPSHKNHNGELFVKGISFATDGTCVRRQQNRDISLKWTEGFVLDSLQELSMSYEIRNVGGADYLIIEWKSGDYVFGNKVPGYYVFVRA